MSALRLRRLALGLLLLLSALPALAKPSKVAWSAQLDPADARAGESARIVLTAKIEAPWHIYSMTQGGDSVKTAFELAANRALTANGKAVQPEPKRRFDSVLKLNLETFERAVAFSLPVKLAAGLTGAQKVAVTATSQTCNDNTCLLAERVEVPVAFTVAPGPARPERAAALTGVPTQPAGAEVAAPAPATGTGAAAGTGAPPAGNPKTDEFGNRVKQAQDSGIVPFLLFSFGAGLLALLTPCVFPMIPITVSFFSKQKSEGGRTSLAGPIAYCAGIVGTFTGLGLAMTTLFGASGIQKFATNPYMNMALAVLFLVLAANLFGAFEILVPAALTNRASAGTRRGGLIGPLLMGLTFTLTSFTCTVPFVGTLLVTASQGSLFYPLLGMLAFSTAFALPFFLLALFPQFLARLPKSGSWLTSVKAYMGFLEVAAAVKFLSNVDLVWSKGILTRPVFLGLWCTVLVIAGGYLLGWLRLPHDLPGAKYGLFRRGFGLANLVAGLYCLAAINGAALGEMESYLPPDPYPGRVSATAMAGCGEATPWIEDYAEGVRQAKAQGKPLFIDFTGVTCTNCRLMEKLIFPRPEVVKELKGFVTVKLFTDRTTAADQRNRKLQEQLAGTVALPYYVVVSPDGAPLKSFPGLTRNSGEFVAFLQAARGAHQMARR